MKKIIVSILTILSISIIYASSASAKEVESPDSQCQFSTICSPRGCTTCTTCCYGNSCNTTCS